jgi:hypothetical protein
MLSTGIAPAGAPNASALFAALQTDSIPVEYVARYTNTGMKIYTPAFPVSDFCLRELGSVWVYCSEAATWNFDVNRCENFPPCGE